MKLTLSVRSFQVPETPFTTAWPPSFPSMPTSRATRVTSSANERQLIDHRVHSVFQFKNFTLYIDGDFLAEIASGDRSGDGCDVAHLRG